MGANYKHIMAALTELKDDVKALPTHADLKLYATAKELQNLREQVEELKRDSPRSLASRVQTWALWLLAVAGAIQLLLKVVGKA